MKIIFLDNDGVICLANNWGSRFKKERNFFTKSNPRNGFDYLGPVHVRFDNFDKKAIRVLNSIIEETGADIVVSSDWRYAVNLEEIGQYYMDQGIMKKPIGFTKLLGECDQDDIEWDFAHELSQTRSIEIKQYLKDNQGITNWVSVDDLNMGFDELERPWGLNNFVLTPRKMEGIKQTGIKEKIIKFLK